MTGRMSRFINWLRRAPTPSPITVTWKDSQDIAPYALWYSQRDLGPARHDKWCLPVDPTLRRQRQEDQKFKGSQSYGVRLGLKNKRKMHAWVGETPTIRMRP